MVVQPACLAERRTRQLGMCREMYESNSVSVVVPAYNEESFVGMVLRAIPPFVDHIYVVDDCSTDKTVETVLRTGEQLATARAQSHELKLQVETSEENGATTHQHLSKQELPADLTRYRQGELGERIAAVEQVGSIVLLRHRENRGAGGAIKTGYLAALVDEMDVVATIDADGQMDPKQLDRFVDPIVAGQADYTKGDRLSSPETAQEMPRFRLFGNRLLTYLTRVVSGYWDVTDPQNGYSAIRGETLARLNITELFEYYGYTNDLLVRLNTVDATVVDVSLRAIYADEESDIRLQTYIWRVLFMLIRNLVWRLRQRYSGGRDE
jgi:glycosyltransferase involved in cell wall biosynthesis